MATLRYTVNGVHLLPALPVERSVSINRTSLRMLSGNQRDYLRPASDTVKWVLTLPDADEAEHAAWLGVMTAARASTVLLVEPGGGSYLVVCVGWADPLTRTLPTSGAGGSSATGSIYRDLTLELESR
jgi:hypothetical protein